MSRLCCRKSEQGINNRERDEFNKDSHKPTGVLLPSIKGAIRTSPVKSTGFSEMADSQDSRRAKTRVIFRCHHEEHKRKAEIKRRKLLRKLKKNYEISVEGFNEHVTNEIIRKVETIEKENRDREKRHAERTMYIVTKLLEEHKSKRKALAITNTRKSRKKPKLVLPCLSEVSKSEDKPSDDGIPETVLKTLNLESRTSVGSPCETRQSQDLHRKYENEEFETEEELLQGEEFSTACSSSLTTSSFIPLEKSLEACPKRIIFQDYKSGEVYLQPLKITNISLETVHCRYLGIVVHAKEKGRFPIAVAVRDSVKLRPGLSCSTKIRLSSKEDAKELECSIVYETRRQKTPLKHSFFFVPVSCLPARAVIRVFPLKINFPTLTWCAATSNYGGQSLRKTINIENTGGRECYCRIDVKSFEKDEKIEKEEMEKSKEEKSEGEADAELMNRTDDEKIREESIICEGEYKEGCLTPHKKGLNMAGDFLNELIENVFATFRFAEKYHVLVPPFTTKQIEVRFIPEYKGFHQQTHIIRFEGCHNRIEEVIELTGDIKKLPLVAEPTLLDLKTCVINSGVYAANFNVFNTSRGPYLIRVRLPGSLKNHAHVHPKGTILQSSSSCEFSVRLYPRLTLSRDVGRYYNEDSGVLEFPVFIHPANPTTACKSDCIKVYVFAVITDYSLQISPSSIDFGHVSTLETVRTPITLTNRSLAVQDFGFLNLPKGVRVEPNMGFGTILPMETISLFVLYSPGVDIVGNGPEKTRKHSFTIKVTSLAEQGGFGEKLEEPEGSASSECILGEYYDFENPQNTLYPEECNSVAPNEIYNDEEDYSDYDNYGECYDSESGLEDHLEELQMKKADEETKIRNYLKLDTERLSEHSFFKRINLKVPNAVEPSHEVNSVESSSTHGGDESAIPETDFSGRFPKPEMNIIHCEAVVTEPYCQLSESVIQLPSTPCSSFSLYRFRLKGSNECLTPNCTCFLRKNKEKTSSERFEASFEFKYLCPQIKLEPQSGFLKDGQIVPISIIYRPEFPADDLCRESRDQKAKKLAAEIPVKETPAVSQPKGKKSTAQSKRNSLDIGEIINASLYELEKYDLFAGERSLQELINPFHIEAKMSCLIRIGLEGGGEKTEIHHLILVCPAVKPCFIFKGTSQEIDFDKVYVGTKARALIEIQNISFERIRPSMSLTNPVGPFLCLSSLRNVPLDPEHVLRQPLIYSPSKSCGVDKDYFEIYCGSTNICLLAKGQPVVPEYKIIPNYGCCILESKIGSAEEFKFEIENLNPMKLKLGFVVAYEREGSDVGPEMTRTSESQKDNSGPGSNDKRKKTESEKKYPIGWEETPQTISNDLERFEKMAAEHESQVFNLIGTDEAGQIVISPNSKATIKIKFTPPPLKYDKGELVPPKRYAIKYEILLENTALLKEILVLGIVSRAK